MAHVPHNTNSFAPEKDEKPKISSSTKKEEREGRSIPSPASCARTLQLHEGVMTKAPAADANRFQTSTIHNGQRVFKRHTHRYEAEVLDEHRLEEWKPVKGKVRNMLEATLLDVQRAQLRERGQVQAFQLHCISRPACNCQVCDIRCLLRRKREGERRLVIAERGSLSEHRRQRARVPRFQPSHIGERSKAVNGLDSGNVCAMTIPAHHHSSIQHELSA